MIRPSSSCAFDLHLQSTVMISIPFQRRGEGERGGGEEGKGGRAPTPSPIRFGLGGHAPPPGRRPPLSTRAHEGPIVPWGVLVTSQYSLTYPILPKTIPVSECNLAIYRSLSLEHFETPHHVRDLIRDSEQTSVIKTHNS